MIVDLRPACPSDEPFLEAMLLQALGWRGTVPASMTSATEKHVRDYGRGGDHGVIAVWAGTPIGAAWYRRFSAQDRSYGYVDDAVPELAVAVEAGFRGRGVGATLVRRILHDVVAQRLPGVSLSVEPDNPARKLYERLGFVRVGEVDGAAWTMVYRTLL